MSYFIDVWKWKLQQRHGTFATDGMRMMARSPPKVLDLSLDKAGFNSKIFSLPVFLPFKSPVTLFRTLLDKR